MIRALLSVESWNVPRSKDKLWYSISLSLLNSHLWLTSRYKLKFLSLLCKYLRYVEGPYLPQTQRLRLHQKASEPQRRTIATSLQCPLSQCSHDVWGKCVSLNLCAFSIEKSQSCFHTRTYLCQAFVQMCMIRLFQFP